NARLNDVERENLDIIRGAEAARHGQVMPGDVRYFRNRTLTSAMLGRHTPDEWRLLSTEVLAMNGHAFNDWPAEEDLDMGADSASTLQYYYDNRYWYQAVRQLKFADLSAEDRALADTIEVARIKDLGEQVTFGMLRLFQGMPLSEQHLEWS